jgi:5-formaminoimidazole-4-carboxamide-1-beta-D-ribofuranosyl 5'-monophosphate synthetase
MQNSVVCSICKKDQTIITDLDSGEMVCSKCGVVIVTVELDLVVYDVSLRVPGNPIMATTSPYTKYYYGHTMGVGRRIAMEVKNAMKQRKLAEIVT